MLNPFREIGDVIQFVGKLLLLYKALTSKECRGKRGECC